MLTTLLIWVLSYLTIQLISQLEGESATENIIDAYKDAFTNDPISCDTKVELIVMSIIGIIALPILAIYVLYYKFYSNCKD